MVAAIEALLGGIVDYAGLFPPAQLGMPESVRNYLRYRSGSESWLVNRFVCPASRLEELTRSIGGNDSADGMALTVVGTGGDDLDRFESGLESDARAMTTFESRMGESAFIEAFEVRVPAQGGFAQSLKDLGAFAQIECYVEIPFDEAVGDRLAAIAETDGIGAKGRTGGAEASKFPTSAALSSFLAHCVDLELAFKLTAGLHEPMRHVDSVQGTSHHGFVNVLAALLWRDVEGASVSEMSRILDMDDASAFELTASGAILGGIDFTVKQMEDVRELFVGFGSCSVDEPLRGLERMGWLGAAV